MHIIIHLFFSSETPLPGGLHGTSLLGRTCWASRPAGDWFFGVPGPLKKMGQLGLWKSQLMENMEQGCIYLGDKWNYAIRLGYNMDLQVAPKMDGWIPPLGPYQYHYIIPIMTKSSNNTWNIYIPKPHGPHGKEMFQTTKQVKMIFRWRRRKRWRRRQGVQNLGWWIWNHRKTMGKWWFNGI